MGRCYSLPRALEARVVGGDQLVLALALPATFIVYVGTLRFDFVYDDEPVAKCVFRFGSAAYGKKRR